ncbi:hypothetical protein BC567DRAFT_46234 [Phyllosticta citribraziliensis]
MQTPCTTSPRHKQVSCPQNSRWPLHEEIWRNIVAQAGKEDTCPEVSHFRSPSGEVANESRPAAWSKDVLPESFERLARRAPLRILPQAYQGGRLPQTSMQPPSAVLGEAESVEGHREELPDSPCQRSSHSSMHTPIHSPTSFLVRSASLSALAPFDPP